MANDAVPADVSESDHPPVLDAEIVAVDGVPVDRAPAVPAAVSAPPPTPRSSIRPAGVSMGLAIPGVIGAAILLGTAIRWLALTTESGRSNAAIVGLILLLVVGGGIALVVGGDSR